MLKFLIIPYILIEILVTWIFVSIFGGFAFKVEVLVSVIIGIFMLIKFGNFRQIDGNFFYFDAIFTKFGLLLAGIFLILPGILGDIFGILILCAPNRISNLQNFTQNNTNNYDKNEIIDVEIIEEDKK